MRSTWALAKNKAQGGVLYMLNADGSAPQFTDWIAPRALQWDEKVLSLIHISLFILKARRFRTRAC